MKKNLLAVAALAAAMMTTVSPSLAERGAPDMSQQPGFKRAGEAEEKANVDDTTTAAIRAVKEGKDEKPSDSASATPAGGKYGAIIAKYAAEHGVPAALAHAVVRVESNYRRDARGSAGEVGLMQIKPSTARMMGYSGSVEGLFDPETNIRFGMKYLGMARSLGDGTTCGTILKYNAGHAATSMNPISAAYCAKVKRLLADA